MTKQETSLFGLEHRDDATVKMLDNSIQYKRILGALEEDNSDTKRARLYARDGLLYAETCLKRYSCNGSTSTMPEPLPLPEAVVEANNSNRDNAPTPITLGVE